MAFKVICLLTLLVACYLVDTSTAILSDEDKEELVFAHNFYRSKAQPTPNNMRRLEWDFELAALSQFWAVGCEIEPNENRHEQSTDYDYVGEIIHGSANYSINLTSMVFEWFFDSRNYDFNQESCIDEDGEAQDELEECEKYLQLVWARTSKFGCGAYRCEEIAGLEEEVEDGQSALLVVCNYGPGGGYDGESPFTTGGEACSACPDYLTECKNNLCFESGADRSAAQVSMVTLMLLLGVIKAIF